MGISGILSLANLASGQVLVIDINGEIRLLNNGEQPLPGELILDIPLGNENSVVDDIVAQQIAADGQLNDVSQEIAGIISAIEQGEDPTQVDPEFAPAAGDSQGSSLGLSGTVGRDGNELLAETVFQTQAGSVLTLSRTQSQGLVELVNSPESSLGGLIPTDPTDPTDPSNPPVAVDDPVAFKLTQGDMSQGSESSSGWDEVSLSSHFNGADSNVNTLDDDRIGVTNGAPWAGPTGQLQYDRESGQSEQLSIKFDQPATEGRFAITNVYANEGEGKNNHETGTWVAYLNGVAVASGVIDITDGSLTQAPDKNGGKAFFDIDTGGYAFDEVVFHANEYTNGLVDDTQNDSSDYFVAGIEVSSTNNYATNQGEELRIPISDILANDSDLDGDALSITFVNADGSRGSVRIDGDDIAFTPNDSTFGKTQLEYQITDGNGGFDTANINIIVNPQSEDALVSGIFLRDSDGIEQDTNQVHEGESLIYTIVLDKPTFGQITFNAVFSGSADASDVDYSSLTFTNGVTLIEGPIAGEYQFVVPQGVKEFDVYVSTIVDRDQEDPEQLTLKVGSFNNEGELVEATAIGTILDNSAPTYDSDPFSYRLTQGDMRTSENGKDAPEDDDLLWQEVTLSGQYGDQAASVNIDSKGQVGIGDGADKGGPIGQIQYDRESGTSEKLSVKLDAPATSGSFTISRLFANEGDGNNNHEAGSWIAYLDGVAVASGAFDGAELGRGNRGEFEIYTDGYAFDEIVFSATEYSQGLQGDTSKDSSDYFVSGIDVEAKGGFTIVRGTTLRIPVALLLENAHDLEGDQLRLGDVSVPYAAGGVKIVDGNIEFYSRTAYKGDTTITVEVIDEHGAIAVGAIPVNLAGAPKSAIVSELDLSPSYIDGDDEFPVTASLNKVALEATRYDVNLTQLSDGNDLTLDAIVDLSFTNGVTVVSDHPISIEVPAGVESFEIYIDSQKLSADGGVSIEVGEVALNTIDADDAETKDNDVILATDTNDILVGGSGDDVLIARSGEDTLEGGLGSDILIGGLGGDILTGGDEADIFKWLEFESSPWTVDSVTDFELGSDKLDVADLLPANSSLEDMLGNILIEKGSSLDITLSDGDKHSVSIALENNNGQFDSLASGPVTGDNLNYLVDSLFIHLPD